MKAAGLSGGIDLQTHPLSLTWRKSLREPPTNDVPYAHGAVGHEDDHDNRHDGLHHDADVSGANGDTRTGTKV